jgi:heme exporter protein D
MSGEAEFFAMGGYGFYIWSSWGVAALILIVVTCHSFIRSNQMKHQLDERMKQRMGENDRG